jgi:two-component system cell cycle sensor histidine kinase/response regulator CckA
LVENTSPSDGRASILVVDDNEAVRTLIGSILRRAGYAIREASDGHEAIELIKQQSESIKLLLTDLTMRAKTGIELIREARAIKPNLSVLAMSADAEHWKKNLTGIPLLSKPFLISNLMNEVESALTKQANFNPIGERLTSRRAWRGMSSAWYGDEDGINGLLERRGKSSS